MLNRLISVVVDVRTWSPVQGSTIKIVVVVYQVITAIATQRSRFCTFNYARMVTPCSLGSNKRNSCWNLSLTYRTLVQQAEHSTFPLCQINCLFFRRQWKRCACHSDQSERAAAIFRPIDTQRAAFPPIKQRTYVGQICVAIVNITCRLSNYTADFLPPLDYMFFLAWFGEPATPTQSGVFTKWWWWWWCVFWRWADREGS